MVNRGAEIGHQLPGVSPYRIDAGVGSSRIVSAIIHRHRRPRRGAGRRGSGGTGIVEAKRSRQPLAWDVNKRA